MALYKKCHYVYCVHRPERLFFSLPRKDPPAAWAGKEHTGAWILGHFSFLSLLWPRSMAPVGAW